MIVASRTAEDILPAIVKMWFGRYGAPDVIEGDAEGAWAKDQEAAPMFSRWGTSFRPRAKDQRPGARASLKTMKKEPRFKNDTRLGPWAGEKQDSGLRCKPRKKK